MRQIRLIDQLGDSLLNLFETSSHRNNLVPLILVIAAGVELWRGITVARLLQKGDAAFRQGDLDMAERCYTDQV